MKKSPERLATRRALRGNSEVFCKAENLDPPIAHGTNSVQLSIAFGSVNLYTEYASLCNFKPLTPLFSPGGKHANKKPNLVDTQNPVWDYVAGDIPFRLWRGEFAARSRPGNDDR